MPAAAVASLTPAIMGISGISVGASGEIEEDMRASGNGTKGSALYHLNRQCGRGRSVRPLPSSRPCAGTHSHRHVVAKTTGRRPERDGAAYRSRLEAGTTQPYFFAGAILLSSGLASGFASVLAAV